MKEFGFTPEFIDWELDGAQGWAYFNWSRENESSAFGDRLENKSPAYVKQEFENLMRQYRESKNVK